LFPQLPEEVMREILLMVVLEDGYSAILRLAMTCQKMNAVVCQTVL
jgi:hypothetical protein